jgi:hypothetical protein
MPISARAARNCADVIMGRLPSQGRTQSFNI